MKNRNERMFTMGYIAFLVVFLGIVWSLYVSYGQAYNRQYSLKNQPYTIDISKHEITAFFFDDRVESNSSNTSMSSGRKGTVNLPIEMALGIWIEKWNERTPQEKSDDK